MQYTIEQIAGMIGARTEVKGEAEGTGRINWLLIDSRSLCFPQETLFFALCTPRNDGHRYIDELYRRGVRYFVVEKIPQIRLYRGATFLLVDDTLAALQQLAQAHRSRFDIPVVAITGSNGKTTVKEWLYQLLSPDYNVCRSPRSYNSQVGVPLSLWLIDAHTDIALIEAGISRTGEMDHLRAMVRPTVGVITNIGQAHQENFRSFDEKCSEKLLLLEHCRSAVLNMSDNCIARCARQVPAEVEHISWNTAENAAPGDATIIVRAVEKEGMRATVHFSCRGELGQYTIPFIDEASIQNSITCIAVCAALKMDLTDVSRRMAQLEPVAMRLEVKDGRNACTLINDTYNSDFHSLDIALDFMSRRPDMQGQRRTLILSDILQSGESARSLYSRVAQLVRNRGVEKFIGVGPELSECAAYFPMESYFFRSTEELLASDVFHALHNELILVKGARQFRFDEVTYQLTLRVHQTIMEVNLNSIVENLNHYRGFTRPGTKMVCMVKANAYGMGAVEVSKTLQEHGVDYLAVAVADEGAELRKAGITANVMVMNPEMNSFKILFDYRLEPEVFNFDILEALIRAAEKEGITNYPIHIKLDTGMNRLGFHPEKDMARLIDRLSHQSALIPCSVFSHFVGSDDDAFDDFSRHQFARYDAASRRLQEAYGHKILRHICNSAAIEHFPEYHMDMVRLGLGLYGVDPRTNRLLSNVATLKSTILQVRDVPAGESIGYGRHTFVDRDSRIADVPIGYADGLNRHLGNRGCHCLVDGQPADYVGNICMDVCMIDVTDIDCRAGDRVTIFGADLPVTVLSDALDTIPYEVFTGISMRVQHVYVQE